MCLPIRSVIFALHLNNFAWKTERLTADFLKVNYYTYIFNRGICIYIGMNANNVLHKAGYSAVLALYSSTMNLK